jgi:hypothetical protein
MLNMMTMQPIKDGEDTQWATLCTIYEIEAEEVYAGTPTTVKLRIEGGIQSGFEQEQIALLGNGKIPVMEDTPVLTMSRRRKNETEEQRARRELISDFLSAANIQSMDDIQERFNEALAGFMEDSLESELDDELGYEP